MAEDASELPIESVKKRWTDPENLVESKYYYGDSTTTTQHFENSIKNQGPLTPVLVRVEDGELAYFEGGKRVEKAQEHDKEVPFYLCDGEWTPEKIMKVQLYENTDALSSEMNMLRLAWCLEDLWEQMDTTALEPSPSELAEELNISERTARRYIEPVRPHWSGTTIGREMFEDGQIRRDAENDKYIINGLEVEEFEKSNFVTYARLEDIRKIANPGHDLATTRELTRFSDNELREKLLAGYIRNRRSEANVGISPEEIRRIKRKIKDDEMLPPKAVEEVLDSEPDTLESTLEGETAEMVKKAAQSKGVQATEFITEASEYYIEEQGIADSLSNDLNPTETTEDDYVDQLDYLNRNVPHARPEPELWLKDNSGLPGIDDESIALTVTSPPYNLDKYSEAVDDDRDYFSGYLAEVIAGTFTDVYQVTKPGGYLCVNVPIVVNSRETQIPKNRYVSSDVKRVLADGWTPTDHQAFTQLQEQTDWQFHHPVIWEKGYSKAAFSPQDNWRSNWGTPPQEDLNTTCEAVLVFKKSGTREVADPVKDQSEVFWRNTGADTDLRDMKWRIPPSQWDAKYTDRDIPTFPEELVRRCILLWSYVGDTVLDPYAGRATTLKMAKRLYRESIGYEIQEELEQDIREYVGMS